MTHRRSIAAGIGILTLLAIPGLPCGPFFLEAFFTSNAVNFGSLRRNVPTVISVSSSTRDLALAYRILNGPLLTPDEWAIAIPTPPQATDTANTQSQSSAEDNSGAVYNKWQEARKAILPNGQLASIDTDRPVPGNDWESFTNCLPDAYANAARTLNARRLAHPQPVSDLVDWVHSQDTVFTNCGNIGAGELPAPLPPTAPLWLRQDRAYQIAAALLQPRLARGHRRLPVHRRRQILPLARARCLPRRPRSHTPIHPRPQRIRLRPRPHEAG